MADQKKFIDLEGLQVAANKIKTTIHDTAKDALYKTDSEGNEVTIAQAIAEASSGVDGAKEYTDAQIAKLDKDDAAVTGQFVTAVSEENGVITVTRGGIETSDVSGLTDALATKQDTVAWQSDNYDKDTNKAITKSDLDSAIAGLEGVLHFVGVITRQTGESDEEAIARVVPNPETGDVVVMADNSKEYIFVDPDPETEGDEAWREIGAEGIYAVKGAIADSDIATDAAIAQSKIAGLTDALDAKASADSLTTVANKVSAVEDKIEAMDYSVSASGDYVASITEIDGVIAPVYESFTFATDAEIEALFN